MTVQPSDPPEDPPRRRWRWLTRRPPRHVQILYRVLELAADVEAIAEQVGALENERGGDTPLGYRLVQIAEELEELSRG